MWRRRCWSRRCSTISCKVVRFASNCATAYLLAQVDEAFLRAAPDRDIIVPNFKGSLPDIQQAFVEWTVAQTSIEVLERLEQASRKERDERLRRLALLRGHLTAMRWTLGDGEHFAAVEAQVSSLIARESRLDVAAWTVKSQPRITAWAR